MVGVFSSEIPLTVEKVKAEALCDDHVVVQPFLFVFCVFVLVDKWGSAITNHFICKLLRVCAHIYLLQMTPIPFCYIFDIYIYIFTCIMPSLNLDGNIKFIGSLWILNAISVIWRKNLSAVEFN